MNLHQALTLTWVKRASRVLAEHWALRGGMDAEAAGYDERVAVIRTCLAAAYVRGWHDARQPGTSGRLPSAEAVESEA